MTYRLVILIICVLSINFPSTAQVFFDSTFHGDGHSTRYRLYNYPGTPDEISANSLVIQTSGEIVATGAGSYYYFRNNGLIDSSLGTNPAHNNGIADIGGDNINLSIKIHGDTLLSLAKTQDINGGDMVLVIKSTPEGQPCYDFGNNGSVSLYVPVQNGFNYGCNPSAIAVQPDGKILVGAMITTFFPGASVKRLLPNGDLDTTFGIHGTTWIETNSCGYVINSFRFLQGSNKIMIAGTYYGSNSVAFLSAIRLKENGIIDSSYADNGISHPMETYHMVTKASAITADNKMLLVSADGWTHILRLNDDGSIDSSYGVNGFYNRNATGYTNDDASAACLDDHERLYILGKSSYSNGATQAHISRVKANGNIDSSFNNTGYFSLGYGIFHNVAIDTMAYSRVIAYGDLRDANYMHYIFLMRINTKPFIERLPPFDTLCDGDTAMIYCHTSGDSIRWYRDNVLLPDTTKDLIALLGGHYKAVVTTNGKNDTSNEMYINFHPLPQPIAQQDGIYLITTIYSYYQWRDSSGVNIGGANHFNFHPLYDGYYSVYVVDENGCSNTSAPVYFIMPNGINEVSYMSAISLYPNPTQTEIHWQMPEAIEDMPYKLLDQQGKLIQTGYLSDKKLDISNLPHGIYLFTFGATSISIVKQ